MFCVSEGGSLTHQYVLTNRSASIFKRSFIRVNTTEPVFS